MFSIAIVSKDQGKNDDYLAAIVNLNGKVDANGSDVIVQTETYSTGSRSAAQYNKASQQNVALSKVTVGGNGEVDGHNIALNARTIASKVNNDIADSGNEWYRWMDKPANFILDNMVHIADMKSSVEVLSGARLTATKDVSVNATTDFNASAKSIFETFAFSYTDLDVVTEAIVRSHANITAENLNVLSTTNIDFTMGAVVTNMVEMGFDVFDHSYGHGGAYAFSVSLLDVSNRAVIEKEVDLNIARDILIDAEMFRSYDMSTKQGWLPIVDRNFGAGSISIAAFIAHTVNEAIMESDVEIPGELSVLANYIGRAEESVSASGTQKGKQGQAAFLGNIAKFFYDMFKMKLGYEVQTIYGRAKGYFDKIKSSLK